MSDAEKILEERLVRGEITEEEFDRLRGKLRRDPEAERPVPTKSAAPQANKTDGSGGEALGKFIGGAIAVYGAAVVFFLVITPPATTTQLYYDGCLKNSNNSQGFCRCVAQGLSEGLNIFTAPLHFFGVGRNSSVAVSDRCNRS